MNRIVMTMILVLSVGSIVYGQLPTATILGQVKDAIQTRISKVTYGILAQEEPICCHVCCGYIQARINA